MPEDGLEQLADVLGAGCFGLGLKEARRLALLSPRFEWSIDHPVAAMMSMTFCP